MLHIVKIPNNEGDINNMRKFILGLSFLGFGDIGFLIVFTYTLFHQSIINGSEGWLINLIANDTLIPVVFFSLWIITGIIICIRSLREYPDCETMTDVAYYYIDELQALGDIPPSLQNYIDYEAYGRDLDMGGCFIETSRGMCEIPY